jgi:hypothetical protein
MHTLSYLDSKDIPRINSFAGRFTIGIAKLLIRHEILDDIFMYWDAVVSPVLRCSTRKVEIDSSI